ncbi:hypothetical protein [Mycobacterium sp. NPDC050441]|uniref:hypothetical protein n=1 Tax=Mycobacterium sp. NPDC050441 TaxID=3155403 RepID=UPI0033D64D3E
MEFVDPGRDLVAAVSVAVAATAVAVVAAVPALADPRVPNDVWIQCTGFSGPNTQWPHALSGCASRSSDNGSGQTMRTAPGSETITWAAPFESGKSFQLVNIANTVLGPSPDCPADHPVKANVSGSIEAGGQYGGSSVTAVICANATDFLLQPGTFFVIHKN